MNDNAYLLSFDIGGTSIKFALLTEDMQIILQDAVPTNQNQNSHILKELIRISKEYSKKFDIYCIGISTAGIVNSTNGSIKYANSLIPNYTGTAIKTILEKEFNIPVCVVNDVQAALLGEMLLHELPQKTYCLTLGTGIGGAYFNTDSLYHGFDDHENYIGQMNFDITSKTNWEQRASTIALQKKLDNYYGLSVPEAFEKARNGNEAMISQIDSWINEIAKGLSNIILLINPSTIIIGGGVSQQNDYILPILKEKLSFYLPESFLNVQLISPSRFNGNALLGALYPFFKNEEEK